MPAGRFAIAPAGTESGVIWLLLFIVALLIFGIWGAIKLTLWVLLIALVVAAIAGVLGRGLFAR